MTRTFLLAAISAASLSFALAYHYIPTGHEPRVEIHFALNQQPNDDSYDDSDEPEINEGRAPASRRHHNSSSGRVTSGRGWRKSPITGKPEFHKGTDYAFACKTPIKAKAGGKVTMASKRQGYGYVVAVETSPGCRAIYGHMTKGSIAVKVGQRVKAGQKLGLVGKTGDATGCHLHYESCSKLYDAELSPDQIPPSDETGETIQSAGLYDTDFGHSID